MVLKRGKLDTHHGIYIVLTVSRFLAELSCLFVGKDYSLEVSVSLDLHDKMEFDVDFR